MTKVSIARLRLLGIKITRSPRALLVAIFLLAFLMRVGYIALFVGFDSPPTYDGMSYDIFAAQLARGEGYHTGYGPTAHKPPLYPLFLAGIYALLGIGNYIAIRMIQAIIGALSTLIIYLLGKRMFGQTIGILASVGASVYPLFVYMTGELYPETLFIFLFSLLLFLAFQVSTSRPTGIDSWSNALYGILFGLTTLSRPNVLIFLPVLVIWPFLNLNVKTAARTMALVLSVTMLVVLPWTIRNYVVFGEFVFLSTEGGVALWQGNNALSAGGGTLANESVWPNSDYPDRGFYGWSDLTEPESDRKFFGEGLRWIREHPRAFVSLIPQKILRAWSPISFTTQSGRTAHPLVRVILFPYLLFLLVVLYGSLTALQSWRVIFPLYTIPVLTSLQAAIFFGGTRYSIPMAPALILFAAVGIESLVRRLFFVFRRTMVMQKRNEE